MSSLTIDTAMARQMVQASAIQGAQIIGQPGGWSVRLKLGTQHRLLGAQRSDRPRLWRSLDRCVDYLKNELQIARFDLLDATDFSDLGPRGRSRQDASDRLRNAHEAAAHDRWFREQVNIGLAEADDPAAEWLTGEQADAVWATQRAELPGKNPASPGKGRSAT